MHRCSSWWKTISRKQLSSSSFDNRRKTFAIRQNREKHYFLCSETFCRLFSTSPLTAAKAHVECFFEKETHTATYILSCSETNACAIIDPVLDFDVPSCSFSTKSADALVARVQEKGWKLEWILETHAHADHITSSQYLKKTLGGKVAIGEGITKTQEVFKNVFNMKDLATDGSDFDHLFKDGETFHLGNVSIEVIHTPGHTPACACYYIKDDCIFVGDTIFLPDFGTARCDFPSGSPAILWKSIQRILSLPDHVRIFVGHDYGEEIQFETTIGESKKSNKHVKEGITEQDFIALRTARDCGLAVPRLLYPSVQLNIMAGKLPSPQDNGTSYLVLPIKAPFLN